MPQELTRLLLDHRASGVLIENLPSDLVPQTAEQAYLVQNETVAILGPIGAWKVQPMPQNGLPFTAPILASTIHGTGAQLRVSDFPSIGIEVEIAVTINRDLPKSEEAYTAADLRPAIASFHLAFEILASRFIDRAKVPQLAGIADLQHSGAIVLGAAVAPNAFREFGTQAITLSIDGQLIATTPGNATTANMLDALAWLANHAAHRGLPLKKGDIVITGARIGPLPVTKGEALATGEGLADVRATFL